MTKIRTISVILFALSATALAAQAVRAEPKVIHISPHGDVDIQYPGDYQPAIDTRPTAELQGEDLPVIIRGSRRYAETDSRQIVIVQRVIAQPYLSAPIAATATRPVVYRPQVVRPQIVRPGRYRQDDSRTSATVIFNGGRSHYDDVDIDVKIEHR